LTNISPAGRPIERCTVQALRRRSRTSGSQTRPSVVLGAFDDPDGASRGQSSPVRERQRAMRSAEPQPPLPDGAVKFDGEVP
jgi:hypothetical protein